MQEWIGLSYWNPEQEWYTGTKNENGRPTGTENQGTVLNQEQNWNQEQYLNHEPCSVPQDISAWVFLGWDRSVKQKGLVLIEGLV